jgi:competence ComEA-like helix-hairpin-helix protein
MYKKFLGVALIVMMAAFTVLISSGTGAAQSAGKVTLNKATAAQLGKVPGVTGALAKAIVDFRTKNGPFKKSDDLLKVPGMTPEILKKMSLKPDPKGEIFLPAGKGDGDDDDEPSLKPSKC